MPHSSQPEHIIFQTRQAVLPLLLLVVGITVLGIISVVVLTTANTLALILIAVVALVDTIILLSYLNTIYTLTNQRLIYQAGIIGKLTETIENGRVSSLELHQGFLGRIFNYGSIRIEGDNPMSLFTFRLIANPRDRLKQIEGEMLPEA